MAKKARQRIHKIEIDPITGPMITIEAEEGQKHLAFDFEVEKHRGVDYDTARINIFNFNKETLKALRKPYNVNYKKTHEIKLYSGFLEHGMTELYEGEIWRSDPDPDYSSASYKLKMICSTSLEYLSKERDIALPEQTNAKQAVETIANDMGTKVSFTEKALAALNKYLFNGRSFKDNIKDIFSMLTKDTEAEFTTDQAGNITVSMPGDPILIDPVVIATNAIISPIHYTERGTQFESILLPEIKPGTVIEPKTNWLDGYSKQQTVEEIFYRGDSWTGQGANNYDNLNYPLTF